jgi:acetyltransferase-like isoleucine patch superfamily enzyme
MKRLFPLIVVCLAITAIIGVGVTSATNNVVNDTTLYVDNINTQTNGPPFQPWMPYVILLTFTLMIVLPFVPGLTEVWKPKDRYPLPIDMDYSRDPRYLGKSARKIFKRGLKGKTNEPGTHTIIFSTDEVVEISNKRKVEDSTVITNVLYINEELESEPGVHFENDIYSLGEVTIGEDNLVRTIAGDSNITLGKGSTVVRWIDSEKDIFVESGCDLGHSTSAVGSIKLSNDVHFRRLFGSPVSIGNSKTVSIQSSVPVVYPKDIESIADIATYKPSDTKIESGYTTSKSIIADHDVKTGDNCTFGGSIKCHGDLEIGDNCTVSGNLFAEGCITIGKNCKIRGSVFSQCGVTISEGSQIGVPDEYVSVIGKQAIVLKDNINIYGYLLTEGQGVVQC